MTQIILYKKNFPAGYNLIVAIKSIIWNWGSGEVNPEDFGMVTLDITEEQIADWENQNKYCVNKELNGIEETPIEYQRQKAIFETIEKVIEEDPVIEDIK